jgi:hypothetical protein
MTIEEMVMSKVRALPPEKQKAVLDFVDSLKKEPPEAKLKGWEGLWTEYGIDVTPEEIAEARREMWGNFPRDIS